MNTHKRLQSKTAIITGRGRGIGKETAIFMPILKKKLHLLYDLKYNAAFCKRRYKACKQSEKKP
jgi:hypothetical protein